MKRYLMIARGLGKVDQNGNRVLQGADLGIQEAEFAAILGPPGSGKSALLRIMGFRDRPSEGDLFWQERLVSNISDAEMTQLGTTAARLLSPGELREIRGRLPPLLLIDADGPKADLLPLLRRLHNEGHAIVLATADPEEAAACLTIYRMQAGTLRLLVCED